MRERVVQRVAVFFLVILLVQDFAHLKYISRPTQLKLREEYRKKRDTSNAVDIPKSRQRRWVTAVLLGATLLATTVSIGVEVGLAITGCCGPNPKACKYKRKFERTMSAIKASQKSIDKTWVACQVKLIWIENTNPANERLWNEIERITVALEKIINGVSPGLLKFYTEYNARLKKIVEKGNKTVQAWGPQDVATNYPSYFANKDYVNIGLRAGGYLFLGGALVWNLARKRARMRALADFAKRSEQLLPRLKAQPKALARLGGDPKLMLNEAVKARKKAVAYKTRFQKIRKVGGNLLNVGLIGFEIYQTIQKFKACDAIEERAKKSSIEIVKDLAKITSIKVQVNQYYRNLTDTYKNSVKDQLIQKGVFDYLRDIKNVTEHASSAVDLKQANSVIVKFIKQIKNANEEKTVALVKELTKALKRVEFTVNCIENKVKSLNAMRIRCKNGAGTLKSIYDNVIQEFGTNSGKCTTVDKMPFTAFADIRKSINDYAKVQKFYPECRLNNPTLLKAVCDAKCNKYSYKQIGKDNNLTVPQVKLFIAKCPPECPIPPAIITSICTLKNAKLPVSVVIMTFSTYPPAKVTAAYNSCA